VIDSALNRSFNILWLGNRKIPGSSRARYRALVEAGHRVTTLDYRELMTHLPYLFVRAESKFHFGPGLFWYNRSILNTAKKNRFQWAWIDGGREIHPNTIGTLRKMGLFLIYGSNDDLMNERGRYEWPRNAVPYFHVHVTPYRVLEPDLKLLGAHHIISSRFGFDDAHCSPNSGKPDSRYATDVIFVGHWEEEREKYILPLIESGIDVTVWGPEWHRSPNRHRFNGRVRYATLENTDYAAAIASAKIALGLLPRYNRNSSTTRSFEIPAIGTFMLAERTDEHLSYFREGKEAEFFESPEEMMEKITCYLSHEKARLTIAEAGHKRALSSRYTYKDVMLEDMSKIIPIFQDFIESQSKGGSDR
jgi:spore maturation protein CgeB